MPRIVVTCDTHLGLTDFPRIQKLVHDIRAQSPDVVAIAGDVGEGIENIGLVLEEFKGLGVPVGVVAGNHDLWNHDKKKPSRMIWEQIFPSIVKSCGAVPLDLENLIFKGTALVGSTAWYDYSAQDPAFIASPDECWKRKGEVDVDAWMIDWPWNDVEFSEMIEPGFRERLQAAQNNPDVRSIIVVTHSPIFEEQITRKPKDVKWGFSNAYYGNLTFGKIVMQFSKVTHAIAGHTHSGNEGMIHREGGSIRAITLDSQYGNPKFLVFNVL